jgi:hypothetical protein
MKRGTIITIIFLLAISLVSVNAFAGGKKAHYELTITNITKGLLFTPILVMTHKKGVTLFTPGSSASGALEELAEGGRKYRSIDNHDVNEPESRTHNDNWGTWTR